MPGFRTSLLLTAIQRRQIHVDKNLYGVSAQVIAPGVLVFGHIFGELMQGYADPVQAPSEPFARIALREMSNSHQTPKNPDSRKPGAADGHTG